MRKSVGGGKRKRTRSKEYKGRRRRRRGRREEEEVQQRQRQWQWQWKDATLRPSANRPDLDLDVDLDLDLSHAWCMGVLNNARNAPPGPIGWSVGRSAPLEIDPSLSSSTCCWSGGVKFALLCFALLCLCARSFRSSVRSYR